MCSRWWPFRVLGTHTPMLTVSLRCQVDNEQHGAGWCIPGDFCQEMSLPSACLYSQGPQLAVNGGELGKQPPCESQDSYCEY